MFPSGTYTCLFCGREEDYLPSDVGDQFRTRCRCGAKVTVSRREERIVYVNELPPETVEVSLSAEIEIPPDDYESEEEMIEAAKDAVDSGEATVDPYVNHSRAHKVYPEEPKEVTDDVLDAVFSRKESAVDSALDDEGAFNILVGEIMVEMDRETSPTVAAEALRDRLEENTVATDGGVMAGDGTDADAVEGPRVLTVVSCGSTKQDLDEGETVPARELYQGSPHVCKDRFGRHSHDYYIASAKFGLVHNQEELPWYDKTLDEMSDEAVDAWADDVIYDLSKTVHEEDFDAVVIIGGKTYTEPLVARSDAVAARILTPWQTCHDVTGVGLGMSWCNEESNWPVNVDAIEEIGEVVA